MILLFPFLFALVDWLENAGFLIVVFGYPAEFRTIGAIAGTLKGIKPIVELIILVLTIVFAIMTIVRRRRQRVG